MPKAKKKVRRILSPLRDLPFKVVFGDEKERLPVTGLIEDVRDEPSGTIKRIRIADPHAHPRSKGGKRPVLDLRARTDDQEYMIEVQRQPTPIMLSRALFSLVQMMAAQVRSGGKYEKMPKSICILICNFRFSELRHIKKYHHRFVLCDSDSGMVYPNSPELHVIELPKVPKIDDGTRVWPWAMFFKSKTQADFESLIGRGAAMKAAVARLLEFSASEKAQILADSYEKGAADHAARLRESRAKGLAKGRAEGKAEGRAEGHADVARSMLKAKMPLADIAKLTGLTAAEVKRLAARK